MKYLKIIIMVILYVISTIIFERLFFASRIEKYGSFWPPAVIVPIVSAALTIITLQLLDIKFLRLKESVEKNNVKNWTSLIIAILVSYSLIINFILMNYGIYTPLNWLPFSFYGDWRILAITGGIWIGVSIKKLLSG